MIKFYLDEKLKLTLRIYILKDMSFSIILPKNPVTPGLMDYT